MYTTGISFLELRILRISRIILCAAIRFIRKIRSFYCSSTYCWLIEGGQGHDAYRSAGAQDFALLVNLTFLLSYFLR
jgi:hypothetical protein